VSRCVILIHRLHLQREVKQGERTYERLSTILTTSKSPGMIKSEAASARQPSSTVRAHTIERSDDCTHMRYARV
jgi:hypothetical protein